MSTGCQKTLCQYVNMSVCQYVNMSVCQYVRMELFSLGIKMKVVQNVIRMSNSHYDNMSRLPGPRGDLKGKEGLVTKLL